MTRRIGLWLSILAAQVVGMVAVWFMPESNLRSDLIRAAYVMVFLLCLVLVFGTGGKAQKQKGRKDAP